MSAFATVVGNLGSDPEKKTSNGHNFAVFSVASNGYANGQEETTWFDVVAFGDNGKFVVDHVKKGSSVVVNGDLKVDKWEKDGVKHSKPKIVASSIRFVSSGKKKDESGGGDFSGGNSESTSDEW